MEGNHDFDLIFHKMNLCHKGGRNMTFYKGVTFFSPYSDLAFFFEFDKGVFFF
jgi:hypothetical protein